MLAAREGTRRGNLGGVPVLALLLVLAALTVWKGWIQPRPFWSLFNDPEAIHFHSTLDLLRGESPSHFHTPCWFLHVLGIPAALLSGSSPLEFDAFRCWGYVLALALTLTGLWLLARRISGHLGWGPAAVGIATVLACPQALWVTTIWGPEVVLLGLCSLTLVAVDRALSEPDSRRRLFVAGAAVGLCCTQRFTLLPWPAAFLGVLLLDGRLRPGSLVADAGAALAGMLSGFLSIAWIAVPRWRGALHWLHGLATRSGTYGTGEEAPPTATSVLKVLEDRARSSTPWTIWLVAIVAGSAWLLLSRRSSPRTTVWNRTVVFCLLAIVGSYILSMRTSLLRYLLPTGVLAAPLAAVVAGRLRLARGPWLFRGMAVLVLIVLGNQVRGDVGDHRFWVETTAETRERLVAAVQSHLRPGGTVVWSRHAPIPVVALAMWTENTDDLRRILEHYPGQGLIRSSRVTLPAGASSYDLAVVPAGHPRFAGVVEAHRVVDSVCGFLILAPK